jgi:penicillin-binding protein 1A
MGRDNARAVGGLEGGRAPAQAWAAFMRVAVANRPVEQFATDVTFPERLEDEDPLLEGEEILVDENGNPIQMLPGTGEGVLIPGQEPEVLDDEFIDRALGRRPVEPEPEVADPFEQ